MQSTMNTKSLVELQHWYVGDLAPKVAEAVRSQKVESMPAAVLDRLLRDLLELNEPGVRAA